MKHVCARTVGMLGLRFALAVACMGTGAVAISTLVAPAFVATARAEDESETHPIDKWYKAQMDKASSTSETREVIHKALEKWDAELNVSYKDLMAKLRPGGKEALKASQLQWIKFRDAEIAFMKESIYAMDGTMWLQVGDDHVMTLTRDRALQLRATSRTLTDGGFEK